MLNVRNMARICIMIFLGLLLTQCAYRIVRHDTQLEAVMLKYETIQPAEIKRTIEALNERLGKRTSLPASSPEHLELAFLYSHYNNPQPDYRKALVELGIYSSVDSEGSRSAALKNWLRMLKEIERLDSSNEETKGQLDLIRKEVAKIRAENADMSLKIEQLKHLDIELEEKKRLVK